jgi:hypothetical protein
MGFELILVHDHVTRELLLTLHLHPQLIIRCGIALTIQGVNSGDLFCLEVSMKEIDA